MKNYLTLVLALAVVSSPAYASRARLESLGEDKNGSYYIDDSRDMFLNPATIIHYKKKLMLELGSQTAPGTVDTGAASRPQGGFTNTFGDFTYAVYLNNTSDRAINTLGAGVLGLAPSNALELALAGEGTIGWGLSLIHGDNHASNFGSYYWAARLGVEKDAWAVFGTIGLASDAKSTATTSPTEIKGNLSVDAAATYKMDSMTGFAHFTSTSATASNVLVAGNNNDGKQTNFGLGAGWKKEMTKSTTMFTRVSGEYVSVTNSNTGFNAYNAPGAKWNIPLVVAAETQALSWLAIRGSISHSLYGQDLNARTGLAGSTSVAAGLGMTFGDITVDGMIGSNSAVNGNAPANLGFGSGVNAGDSFGFGNNMISRIAMTYNF